MEYRGVSPKKGACIDPSHMQEFVSQRSYQVANLIRYYLPDLVCMQENITIGDQYSQARQIAELVENYQYSEFVPHEL